MSVLSLVGPIAVSFDDTPSSGPPLDVELRAALAKELETAR